MPLVLAKRRFPAPFGFGPAGFEIADPQAVDRDALVGIAIVRIEREHRLVALQGFIGPQQMIKAGSEISVPTDQIRLDRDSAPGIGQRLLQAIVRHQEAASIDEGFGKIRSECNRAIERDERLIETSQLVQCAAEIAESNGATGIDLGRLAIVCDGFLGLAHPEQEVAKLDSGVIVFWVGRKRHRITGRRFFQPLEGLKTNALPIRVSGRPGWIAWDCSNFPSASPCRWSSISSDPLLLTASRWR